MNEDVLKILAQLKAQSLRYLAELVDFDTTGDKDDPLYLLLMEAYQTAVEEGYE